MLAHRRQHLVQRQVRLILDESQQKLRVLLQRRGAPAARPGAATACLTKALHPDYRRTGADFVMFGRLTPRCTTFYPSNHALTHVRRVGPSPSFSALQSESMPIDSLIDRAKGILPDSFWAEHCSSRAFPKFESYGVLEMAASVGWKVKDAIVGFHGIGRLGRKVFVRPCARQRLTAHFAQLFLRAPCPTRSLHLVPGIIDARNVV
jgi:hypothetical protein